MRLLAGLKKAAEGWWTVLGENQVVGTQNLRPDRVICKENEIIIIDVTVPFENGLQAFERARNEKLEKYDALAKELSVAGKRAKVVAFIVGSLGSWDPQNDKLLRRICSKTYAKKMRQICVSETIAYSNDIFYEHTRGVPQDSGGRQMPECLDVLLISLLYTNLLFYCK